MWCNNGKIEKVYSDTLPDGFVKGRIHRKGVRELEFERQLSIIDKNAFIEYYSNHNVRDTMAFFGIYNKHLFRMIRKAFGFNKEKPTMPENVRTHESYVRGGKKSGETQRRNWQLKSQEEKDSWAEKQRKAHSSAEYLLYRAEKAREDYRLLSDEVREKRNRMRSESMKKWWSSLSEEDRQNEINKHFNGGAGYHTANSKPNLKFIEILEKFGIEYSREFRLENYSYDFKVGNNLIEINPASTHNSTWSPFGNPVDKNYHKNKSDCARRNGFNCICVWDWDDLDKIVSLISKKEKIFARKCCIKELEDVDEFLNENHLQGSCKGQSVKIGLFYNDELVEVITFGKPRYNNNYEWELLRLCSKRGIEILGGASKLFKYFIKTRDPESVISYCDDSKFDGNIYSTLGFSKLKQNKPSAHWYNLVSKTHITDNMLRKHGFDRLVGRDIGECYGKNTSNKDLMIEHGFVEIYDCGQSSYKYKNT